MLQDRQIDRALAVDVHDVGLRREAVAHMADIADGDRHAVEHADRQRVEALHRRGAGVELHVVGAVADPRRAGGHDHVGRLQRGHHVVQRKALGRQSGRIDIDIDLPLLAAERPRRRQARNGEQLHPDEVQAVVVDLLLGQRLRRHRQLHHRHVRSIELDHRRRLHPGRRAAQDRVVDRGDLRDRAADVGAGLEIHLQDADARDRLRFDPRDAVDGGGIGALADEHDAAFHVLGGQAGIVPHHQHDGNVDDRKDVDDHPRDRQRAEQDDQHRGNRGRVGPAQGEAHQTDHARLPRTAATAPFPAELSPRSRPTAITPA